MFLMLRTTQQITIISNYYIIHNLAQAFLSLSVSLFSLSLDSIRTMNKYNDAAIDKPGATLDTKLDIRLKQCRGQRNFYITGFSLFLML